MALHQPQFRQGDLILSEDPWIYACEDVDVLCYRCLQYLPESDDQNPVVGSLCTGCRHARYCSVECQKVDWKKRHRLECPVLKRMVKSGCQMSGSFILVLKAMLKLQNSSELSAEFCECPSDFSRRIFADLISHREEMSRDQNIVSDLYRKYSLLATLLKVSSSNGFPSTEVVLEVMGKVRCNSYGITDDCMIQRSGGLFLNASVFDHSCRPNAVRVFEGPRIYIRATEDISTFKDVRLSYVDQFVPVLIRRRQLQSIFYFTCHCQRCDNPDEDAEMFGLKCGNIQCYAVIPSDERANTVCSSCHFIPEIAKSEQRLLKFSELVEQLEAENESLARETALNFLTSVADIVHPTNPFLAVCIGRLLSPEKDVAHYFSQAAEIYRHWLPHPKVQTIMGWTFFQAGMVVLQDNPTKARSLLTEAERILCVTHGVSHRRTQLVQEILKSRHPLFKRHIA